MADMSDQTAFQAWLVAIPSAITAFSTWYMSRKATKIGSSTQESTARVVTEKSDETKEEVLDLKKRVSTLEQAIHQTRDAQILISQKYTETMDRLHTQVSAARSILQNTVATKVENPAPPVSVPAKAPVQDHGKVIVEETPKPPIGKVTWKP